MIFTFTKETPKQLGIITFFLLASTGQNPKSSSFSGDQNSALDFCCCRINCESLNGTSESFLSVDRLLAEFIKVYHLKR